MKKYDLLHIISFVLLLSIGLSCTKSEDANTAPVADFVIIPEVGDTSMVITFDASTSTDAQDAIADLMFSWDFVGDNQFSDFSSSSVIQYKYGIPATYTVNLQVQDTKGWVDFKTKEIIISDTLLSVK